jgi:hypothetical protein
MRPLEMESPAGQGGAFAGVFSSQAERSLTTATAPAGQRLPRLIARHLGGAFLAEWTAGGSR